MRKSRTLGFECHESVQCISKYFKKVASEGHFNIITKAYWPGPM